MTWVYFAATRNDYDNAGEGSATVGRLQRSVEQTVPLNFVQTQINRHENSSEAGTCIDQDRL